MPTSTDQSDIRMTDRTITLRQYQLAARWLVPAGHRDFETAGVGARQAVPLRRRIGFHKSANAEMDRKMPFPEGHNSKAAGPVLVFLHEGLGSISAWGDFPRQLVAACGLPGFLYDRLGHGRSDPLPSAQIDPDYIEQEAWGFLPRVLDRCAIRDAVLIGHSDGGTIALMYAARYPEAVAGIVTEAAHIYVEEITRRGIREVVDAYRRGELRARLQKHHGADLDALFDRWSTTWLSDAFATWNVQGLLSRVRCPVLAIQGEKDPFATPRHLADIACGVGGPARSLLVPGAGHIPHHQRREAVMAPMRTFIHAVVAGNGASGAASPTD